MKSTNKTALTKELAIGRNNRKQIVKYIKLGRERTT